MHINSVLSFLGAWEKLQVDYHGAIQELQQVIASLDESELSLFFAHYQLNREQS